MKLSLSVRIAESRDNKERLVLPFEQIVTLAREAGYAGLSMRASVVSVRSPREQVQQVRSLIDRHGLVVSMVTGDLSLAINDAHAADALRDITPYLDLAQALGSRRIRVMLQRAEDIPYAQRAADEARERDLLLCHQTHTRTLCETVDESIETVRRVGRPNFGITYEPTQLVVCGDDYGPRQIARLAPYLLNVYLQNWYVGPDGSQIFQTNRGSVRGEVLALDDPRGIHFDRVFEGLHAIGYDGWVTVHATAVPGVPVDASIRRYYHFLAPLVGTSPRRPTRLAHPGSSVR